MKDSSSGLKPQGQYADVCRDHSTNLRIKGQDIFENLVSKSIDLKETWEHITGGQCPEYFGVCYMNYIIDGFMFKEQFPREYGFLRDNIFHGRQFDPGEIKR